MTKLRFRLTQSSPSASLIARLRQLTKLSILENQNRVQKGESLLDISAFTNTWQDDRVLLVEIKNHIEAGDVPLSVTEVFEDDAESDVSKEMFSNLISGFRSIELETQRNAMLEFGEIDDPVEFEPCDDDWTR